MVLFFCLFQVLFLGGVRYCRLHVREPVLAAEVVTNPDSIPARFFVFLSDPESKIFEKPEPESLSSLAVGVCVVIS